MKKLVSNLMLSLTLFLATFSTNAFAEQEENNNQVENIEAVEEINSQEEELKETATDVEVRDEPTFTQEVKKRFLEGGVTWMIPVLACLILGIATAIERIIYLSLSNVNTKKVLQQVEEALNTEGVEGAKEVCRNTRGPVGAIFYDGLVRSDEGIEQVEKSVIAGGSVQMGLMEKGVSWISLYIALAPMLGFLGTVIGMIDAFDVIQLKEDINPGDVAGGIKVALLTTVFGLIVAIILQVFYNYLVSKIDSIVNDMEDASISLIDLLGHLRLHFP